MSDHTIFCFSHLRWGFVYQRPNHLMARAAKSARVFFIEEPVVDGNAASALAAAPSVSFETHTTPEGVTVCTPHIPPGLDASAQQLLIRRQLDELIRDQKVTSPWCWYYSPMMLPLGEHLEASRIIYDCMDELSAFAGAPPELREREAELLRRADVVFTGGHSLFEAKRPLHPNVHAFPSSVDAAHFSQAKTASDPADQQDLPHPRVGFFGVIDERLDVDLVRTLAAARPSWQIVMIGPVVKIDPSTLPRAPNIHWSGGRSYAELPSYLGGWDVAILPFALNEATRYISPTKTLEYLAAGKVVVSTAIHDVVHPYGMNGLVRIADRMTFPSAIDASLAVPAPAGESAVAEMLAGTSWDQTWAAVRSLVHSSRDVWRAARPPDVRRTTSRPSESAALDTKGNFDT